METIQELIALYAETKNSDAYKKIIEAIQTNHKIWIAYSPVTKNHYIEYFHGRPTAFIFSEKEFCEAFKEHLAPQKVKIESELCKLETRVQLFSDLFRSGFQNIVVDNGQQFICMSLFDIIDKPDFSSLPPKEQPVLNPSLVVSANIFFQTFDAGTSTKNTRINMLRALYKGKYLMPVIVDRDTSLDNFDKSVFKAVSTGNGTTVTIPAIHLDDGQTLIPFFTDWTEFSHFDRDKQCVGNIVTFRDIEYFCNQNETIAVNPFGFNMVIDRNALNVIKKVSSDIELDEDNEEDDEPITLFELRSVPNDMIHVLQTLMNQTDGVNAAYLKGMNRGERTSYLVIVDFNGADTSVFNSIAQQVGSYTQGVPIDFVLLNSDFGRQAAQSTYPFFQRY